MQVRLLAWSTAFPCLHSVCRQGSGTTINSSRPDSLGLTQAQAEISQQSFACQLSATLFCIQFAADWDTALAVNIKGYALGIKHAARAMIAHAEQSAEQPAADASAVPACSQCAIVSLSSVCGMVSTVDNTPYSVAKAAVLGMTRNCALDLGKHNIRCGRAS